MNESALTVAGLFEKRLYDALNVALGGSTAIVIVPKDYPKHHVFSVLVRMVPQERSYQVRVPGNELHFEGTRGSVRVYSSDHAEYSPGSKTMRGYPHSTPTFLHPEVEGL